MTQNATMIKPMHLVIRQQEFLNRCRTILLDPGTMATCTVRRRETAVATELILEGWLPATELPNGQKLPPLADWGVVTADFDQGITPERLIEMVKPKQSQLVVAIALNAADHQKLAVIIFDQGRLVRPEGVRFIGTGMVSLPEVPLPSVVTTRASRTAGALGALYHRLTGLSVLMVGAGRGGQELARQLVACGVRQLTIIDGDKIGPENLDAMPLSGPEEIDQFKAVQLANTLRRNQPDLNVHCLPKRVTHADAVRVLRERRFDVVCSFVDSDAARLAVARLCQETITVHLDIGTLIERSKDDSRQMAADIRLFEPHRGCVACVPQMERLEDVLYELSTPEACLFRGEPVTWDKQRAGSLLHLNALGCSVAIETWLGWLAGKIHTSHWVRAIWPAFETPIFHALAVGPRDDCRFCQRRPNQVV